MLEPAERQSESTSSIREPNPQSVDWGTVRGAAMRLTYFSPAACTVPLEKLRNFFRANEASEGDRKRLTTRLVDPIRSMHEDLVTPPFAVDAKLPLVILCEAPDNEETHGPQTGRGRRVSIEVKPDLEMNWEGKPSTLALDDSSRFIEASLVDSICIFENGAIAYCVSFVFDSVADAPIPFPGVPLLVLASAWGESAGTWITEFPVSVGLKGHSGTTLHGFLHARLRALRTERDSICQLLDPAALPALMPSRQKHRKIQADDLPSEDELAGLRRTLEGLFGGTDAAKPTSIGVEVIGSSLHQDILKYAFDAEKRQVGDDERSKALAGLIQNVFDYHNQDIEEVNDSLASKVVNHPDITFASRGIALRFCVDSRPYREKRYQVGGSPYWMLVELIAGHNSVLLQETLERDVDLNKLSRDRRVSRSNTARRLDDLRRQQEELDQYIPNIFHYPTERQLYGLFATAWDLDSQDRMLRQSQQLRELKIRRDDEWIKDRESSALGNRLVALSIGQLGSAIAAILILSDFYVTYQLDAGEHKGERLRDTLGFFARLVVTPLKELLPLFITTVLLVVVGFAWLLWTFRRTRPPFRDDQRR